jgi:hypothetical protein
VDSRNRCPVRSGRVGLGDMTDPDQLYRWHWRARLPERHGQLYRVLCRGKLNSCLIVFEDGWHVVTSRNALRKVKPEEPISWRLAGSSPI